MEVAVHFSDFFAVAPADLEDHGAFDVSLIADLPLFVDPFLLFNSTKAHYRDLHDGIIRYLRFLRDKSILGHQEDGLLAAWYTFPEVKQTWLGYSKVGNRGSGLGPKFAGAVHNNLETIVETRFPRWFGRAGRDPVV